MNFCPSFRSNGAKRDGMKSKQGKWEMTKVERVESRQWTRGWAVLGLQVLTVWRRGGELSSKVDMSRCKYTSTRKQKQIKKERAPRVLMKSIFDKFLFKFMLFFMAPCSPLSAVRPRRRSLEGKRRKSYTKKREKKEKRFMCRHNLLFSSFFMHVEGTAFWLMRARQSCCRRRLVLMRARATLTDFM